MSEIAVNHQHSFTYGDYLTWPEDQRWEIIDGTPYNMTPAPSTLHQRISRELFTQINTFLAGQPCEVFYAPFDVRLPDGDEADERITDVVQPDITVVCDPAKIDKAGCRGAPDFVIEIISPSTAAKDQVQKKHLYEKHGVREYWILHPIDQLLHVWLRGEDDRFLQSSPRELKGQTPVQVLPGLQINLDLIATLCTEANPPRQINPSPAQQQ
jgi:Uma2 family endonuclease